MSERFRVVPTMGEGQTVFSVVDTMAPEDEQPAVVRTFNTSRDGLGASARWLADDYAARHNAKGCRHAGCPNLAAYTSGTDWCRQSLGYPASREYPTLCAVHAEAAHRHMTDTQDGHGG